MNGLLGPQADGLSINHPSKPMGLLQRINMNPGATQLLLSGLGMLGAKRQNQLNPYLAMSNQAFNRISGQKDRAIRQQLADAQAGNITKRNALIDAQIADMAKSDPTEWSLTTIGAGDGMQQRAFVNPLDPNADPLAIGQPFTPGAGVSVNVGGFDWLKSIPNGYMPVDYSDPSKGIKPIPGWKGGADSAETAKTSELAGGGVSAIEQMLDMEEGGLIDQLTLGKVQFTPDVLNFLLTANEQKFKTLRNDIVDRIGRFRSGGAINKDEQANFMSFLPQPGDDPSVRVWKLQTLNSMFANIEQSVKPAEAPPTGNDFSQYTDEQLQMIIDGDL